MDQKRSGNWFTGLGFSGSKMKKAEIRQKDGVTVHANAELASSTVVKDYENEGFFNRYLSIVIEKWTSILLVSDFSLAVFDDEFKIR